MQYVAPDEAPSALLTLEGRIRSLNAPMAEALGRPVEESTGHVFSALLPESQRAVADVLLRSAPLNRTPARRVVAFPGPDGVAVSCLVEAVLVETDGGGGDRLVQVREVDARGDPESLLTAFQQAGTEAGVGLYLYSALEHQLEWLGGSPSLAKLAPAATVSPHELIGRVHPNDVAGLRQVMHPTTGAEPSWIRCRFLNDHDSWCLLACQNLQVRLGYKGPARRILLVRDEREARRQEMLTALFTERDHTDRIAAFFSVLLMAATEQELQQAALARIAPTFDGTGTMLAFVDRGFLRISSDAGIDPRLTRALDGMPLDEPNPLAYAIRTGKPQFIPHREDFVRRWPQGAELLRLSADIAISIAPFNFAGDRPLGAWAVVYECRHRPSPDERMLIATLADLTGQALKRIRLQQARDELATVLQQNMLPPLPKRFPGLEIAARYQSAREGLDVGGDWYDAFLVPDGTAILVIGDVEGHDVDAAAFMGQVRASMRALASYGLEPGSVLARTNELFVVMAAVRFASCTILRFDPRDGRITGSSAGHVPVLWARGDGSHGIRYLPGGPVLGVLAGTDYPQQTFTLEKGSALVLVTDGVLEGPDMPLAAGLDRVGALAGRALGEGLGAEETAVRVLDAASAIGHLDDATVLVIRRI